MFKFNIQFDFRLQRYYLLTKQKKKKTNVKTFDAYFTLFNNVK